MKEKIRSLGKKVSEQYLLLCKHTRCIMHKWKRRTKTYQTKVGKLVNGIKVLVHAQDSCACTTHLCMHNTLVHALKGRGRKAGTQKKTAAGPARGGCFSLGPGLGPWPLQCMHKTVVHAQECCACTRILCMHKKSCVDIILV